MGRVLIVGGADGIGSAVADAVADAGGQPIVMDHVAPRRPHVHFAVNLSDPVMAGAVAGFIAADGLDAVIASTPPASAEQLESSVPDERTGVAAAIRESLRALHESQGRIVAVRPPTAGTPDPAQTAHLVLDLLGAPGRAEFASEGSSARVVTMSAVSSGSFVGRG
jgi:NAD(P)-dependent dehydrogenase (short-subunit alcohol dehydrogenase family)